MKLATAQLQESSAEDRVFTACDYAIVLDGATSFDPDAPGAGAYVDALGRRLRDRLTAQVELRTVLADAIRTVAEDLALVPGHAPSSTVAIVRHRGNTIETLLLGDSLIVVGGPNDSYTVITDDRLSRLDLDESRTYRQRLRAGSGYDDDHREILRALQRRQREHRNRPDGYWIAEADPTAADHAISGSYQADDVPWIALATDGAANCLAALHLPWSHLAGYDADSLQRLLTECHRWEAEDDPNGRIEPRAKRHDDKTLVIATT
ncbi:protein phosphatase 2C domain-containing protein [Nocardia aobensis]|uniref:protein phosphatase 2C domain-containing protein n=1 Tax=Nocardia aobensis TaxID=257277 RepID=UPI00056C4440|nr:protein phosphatase 2C domain-containing protein [Nocardia aobensis]